MARKKATTEELTSDPHITYLKAEHIGLHSEFALDAKDMRVVEISGTGESGKTTILNMIAAALTGKDVASLVTTTENEGWIETNVAGLQIRRTLRQSKGGAKTVSLEVRDAQGEKVTRPQEYLDRLFGGWVPRPIDLYYMRPKDRVKMVLQALNVDAEEVERKVKGMMDHLGKEWRLRDPDDPLGSIQQAYDWAYEARADANKAVKELAGTIEGIEKSVPSSGEIAEPTPPSPVNDLYQQKMEIERRHARFSTLCQALGDLVRQFEADGFSLTIMDTDYGDHDPISLTDLQAQIDNYEQAQRDYTEQFAIYQRSLIAGQQLAGLRKGLVEAQEKAKLLDTAVKTFANMPAEILSGLGDTLVPGMAVNGEDILIEGVPIEAHGDSAKLMACVRVAMALAPPNIKVLLMDGAERMDSAQRVAITRYAIEQGYQVVMTRVADCDLTITTEEQALNTKTGEVNEPAGVVADATACNDVGCTWHRAGKCTRAWGCYKAQGVAMNAEPQESEPETFEEAVAQQEDEDAPASSDDKLWDF